MSRGKRGAAPVVSRAYSYTPDACVRALTLVLKNRDSKKADRLRDGLVGRDGAEIKEDSADENYTR
jgi:hypothetical protein